jgi:hypothetical protein
MRSMTINPEPLLPRPPQPVADLTPENLRRLVEGLEGPGWYTSKDLYGWYVSEAERAGLSTVSQRKFGAVLRELGYKPSNKRVGGRNQRGWFISQRAFRGGTPDNPGGTHPHRVVAPSI